MKVEKKGKQVDKMLQIKPWKSPQLELEKYAAFDQIASDHRGAILGDSEGVKGAFSLVQQNETFDTVYQQRCKEKMKVPKVLIQTQLIPGKP